MSSAQDQTHGSTQRKLKTSSQQATEDELENTRPHTNPIPTLKVVLLGDSGVGKTCLRSQFVHHMFTNAYKATIGGDYLTTTIQLPPLEIDEPSTMAFESEINGSSNATVEETPLTTTTSSLQPMSSAKPAIDKVNLQIWDTAGQERFNSISQAFYRGADVCVLCYDITNYESVLSLKDWFSRFVQHCHVSQPGVILAGNKLDRGKDRVVDKEEIKDILTNTTATTNIGDYVYDWELDLLEVSAKQLPTVESLFTRVGELSRTYLLGDDYERRKLQDFDNIDLRDAHKEVSSSSRCAC
ncbi:hypothetical protein CANMA_005470 [Candida margitis]|uniref:uncharacterized protein n=1 Tax=Candida margitis TaxID=1775924 RepID=UPI0022279B34|nr:uncharacterized protein CANMA_005470 [Candida margitis]KAI5949663.1 hypothetical protein CANMA_005470 [Candida margitis]